MVGGPMIVVVVVRVGAARAVVLGRRCGTRALCLRCSCMCWRRAAGMSSCVWAHQGSLVGRKCLGGCCRLLTGCMTAVGCMLFGVGCRVLIVPGTVGACHSVGSVDCVDRMLGMVLVNVDRMAVAAAGRTLHRLRTLEIDPAQASPGDIRLVGHMADHTVPGCCCCKTGHRSQMNCFVDIHNLAKLGTCPGQETVLLQVLLLLPPRLPWIHLSHYHCDLACPTPCLPSFAALAVPLLLCAHLVLPSTSA